MNITREQILALEKEHSESGGGQTAEQFFDFCYALIALAQEVEPLKWDNRLIDGVLKNVAKAQTKGTQYDIFKIDENKYIPLATSDVGVFLQGDFSTLEEAKEAAQQDYAKRVKSGLKYGGGE